MQEYETVATFRLREKKKRVTIFYKKAGDYSVENIIDVMINPCEERKDEVT